MKKYIILGICALYAIIGGITNLLFFFIGYPFVTYYSFVKKCFGYIIQALPQKYREVIQFYDSRGLKHNIHYLDEIKHEIFNMPIEKQADFADLITINSLENLSPEIFKELAINPFLAYQHSNTTSIGNLAYIILNTTDLDVKSYAQSILDSLTEYHNTFN